MFYFLHLENDALLKEIEQSEVLLVDPYLIIPIVNDIKKIKWIQGIWAGIVFIFLFF